MSTILTDTTYEYEVSQQADRFHVVKYRMPDDWPDAHYVITGKPYRCDCPAYKSCKHIKMVKLFRQRKYITSDILSIRFNSDAERIGMERQ